MKSWAKFIAVVFVIVLALVVLLAFLFGLTQHWLAIHTGTLNESGPYYGFLSGAGSDISELTLVSVLITGIITAYKVRECHSPTCHWPAQHTTADGHRLCKKCIGRPHHELNLHFIHPHHKLTSEQRENSAI